MADPTFHLSIPVDDLAKARQFYEQSLGCRIGRARDDWLDVWFFGTQLTLQHRPDEVLRDQGVRHFGVVLFDVKAYTDFVERLRAHDVTWLSEPMTHTETTLSGKTGGKLVDPSGNVVEIKYYADRSAYLT